MPKPRNKTASRERRWARFFLLGVVVGGGVVWGALTLSRTLRGTPGGVGRDPVRTPARNYAWAELPEPAFPQPPYARYLQGVTIVLDPGHVGQRDRGGTWKRGPTGLREAEVNLRVAQFLREFLDSAGAEVVLTRAHDRSLDLSDAEDLRRRAEVANRLRADLLLSIHHNGSDDPQANYTSLFYHSSPQHSRASLCAARHLMVGLNDALRLERHLACAVLDDRVLFQNGLAVLRQTRGPAVLSEASFHSNPQEEARLRNPLYNRREAYGLFLGLARWAQAGLPRVRLVQPGSARVRNRDEVVIALDNGLSGRGGWGAERDRILPDSLVVRLDGRDVAHRFDARAARLHVTIGRAPRGSLFVDFANVFGQHVLHPQVELELGPR